MYKTTLWQCDMEEQCLFFGKSYESRLFSVPCSVSISHRGLGLEWANNMPVWCEIRALQDRREIGWLVLHSGNCSCLRLPDTRGALCINWSHIRSRNGQQRGTGLCFSLAPVLAFFFSLGTLHYHILLHEQLSHGVHAVRIVKSEEKM